MSNKQAIVTYVEEAKECLAEALDLLLKLKDLVKDAKPMIQEISIVDKEFNSSDSRSEAWLAKFKELFPNEA